MKVIGMRTLGAGLLLAGSAVGGALTGAVRDRFGGPVEGAWVRLAQMKEGPAPCGFHPAVDSVLTDSAGRFRFESPALAGLHEVLVTKGGSGTACDFAEVTDSSPLLELALGGPDSPGTLRGVAVYRNNPQVRVPRVRFIFAREFLDLDTLETDSAGRFSLEGLPPDPRYTVRVVDGRVARTSYVFFDLRPGETRLARMELDAVVPRTGNASITGKVIDRVTSEPLRNALVRLEEKAARDLPIRDSTRTDAEGNYTFAGLPETGDGGSKGFGYIVIARGERYSTAVAELIPLRAGERKTVDLSLQRILALRVRVRTADSAGGLAGASVVLHRAGEVFPGHHAVSDSAGAIRFGQLQPGDIGITVAKSGYRTRLLGGTLDGMAWEDTAEAVLEVDVPVTSRSLHGRVTDPSGRPVAARFFFSCAATGGEAWLRVFSGGDGSYVLPGIPAECADGHAHAGDGRKTAVTLAGADTRLDLVQGSNAAAIRKGPRGRAGTARIARRGEASGRDALGRVRPGRRPGSRPAPLFRESAR